MWTSPGAEEMIEEMRRNFQNLDTSGELEVISDPQQIEHTLSAMLDKIKPSSGGSSSSSDDDKRNTPNCRTNLKRSCENRRPSTKVAVKTRNYKDDKQEFDSFNVFNRRPPPRISPHALPEHKESPLIENTGNEDLKHTIKSENVENPRSKTECVMKTKRDRNPCEKTRYNKVRLKKKTPKKKIMKRPISRKTAIENEKRFRRYSECRLSTKERVEAISEELKHLEEEGNWRMADDVLKTGRVESDSLMETLAGSTAEQQLDYLRSLVEMRSRKSMTGHLWDSAVIFIDQGLAYNQIAKEKRIWKTRWGSVTTDVNDPASDAVILTGLSLGGLLFPNRNSIENPFDYTNSFIDVMMEKYPVLCKADEDEKEPDYPAFLKKFALTFPLLVTTLSVLNNGPKIMAESAKEYDLPPVVYYQGFPSLTCQHLLEKGTNIVPFLMLSLLYHLGDTFRNSNPKQRLCIAWIVWKHLKKMIDSTSLPWVCRESFCRRHGICDNPDGRPNYLPKRMEAQQDIAASMPAKDKLFRLLVEIDEFDFRTNCPAVNSLAVSISDLHYMNVFYSVAVNEIKDASRKDEETKEETRDSDTSDTLEVIEKNLRKTEEELILEAASVKEMNVSNRSPHSSKYIN